MTESALRRLPVGSVGHKSFGWWGMLTIIMTEGALFAYLLFSYYYFLVQYGRAWVPEKPSLALALPNTAILLFSSLCVWSGETGAERGRTRRRALGLAAGWALGFVFIFIQALEWREKPFTPASSSYGSAYFITTGFHMAHVVVGVLLLVTVFVWSILGLFDRERHAAISIAAIYWHFVDLVWLTIFFTFYLTPYIG